MIPPNSTDEVTTVLKADKEMDDKCLPHSKRTPTQKAVVA